MDSIGHSQQIFVERKPAARPMEPRVRLATLGDVALVTREALRALSGASGPLSFVHADIILANLEAPVGRGDPAPEKINLFATEKAISSIRDAGINIVNLANNHILDYGEIAAKRTIRLLEGTGIAYCGIKTEATVYNRKILDVSGIKVAFLGYASPTTHPVFVAGNFLSVEKLDLEKAINDIEAIKPYVDHVVVSLHWGLQNQFYPTPTQLKQAHSIIEAGASVIVGHHAHVFQGVEVYEGGIICYGLGNFIFPDFEIESHIVSASNCPTRRVKWKSWNRFSLVPVLELGVDFVKLRGMFFTSYDPIEGSLEILDGAEQIRMQRRLNKMSWSLSQPYYPVYWQFQKRITSLILLWKGWLENNCRPVPSFRHVKALFNQVIRGRLPELEDEHEEK